ncbi:MAG: hypothetical protein Q9208_005313 [Pyrenodesmia sp. 3 TL-2023]
MLDFKGKAPIPGVAECLSSSDAASSRAASRNRKIRRVHRSGRHEAQALEEPGTDQEYHVEIPQIKRQASKGRLLSLFSRTKSTKLPSTGVGEGFGWDEALDQERNALRRSNTTSAAQNADDISFADLIPTLENPKQQPPKARRSKSFKKDPSTTKSMQWDPPPLFQAYPQSVKHGTTLAPAMSADTILRFHADRKRRQKKKDTMLVSPKANGANGEDDLIPGDGREELQELELSQKIYVLVTSGYILQYSGGGSFDRLPEKIMPIGPDSAAFASDAIPGKHWVLQVSHALDENGSAKLEKRSIVKRLGLRGDMKRCSALNFLMVLNDPEDLGGWLSIVKGELEAWGGKRYQPDPAVACQLEELPRTLQQRPSRPYLVKRDPVQFSSVAKEANGAVNGVRSGVVTPSAARKHSTATQESVHSPSTSNKTASTDQVLLDRLRSSPRMSPVSTGTKAFANSRESSPVPSPTRLDSHLDDFCCKYEGPDKAVQAAHTMGQAPALHLPQRPRDCSLPPTLTQPLITIQDSLEKAPTAAPNFSVPNFSKRYSSAHSTPPPLSTASSNTSNPSRKPRSPPTIPEQHDDFQDIADAAAEASATEQLDSVDLSVADGKQPIPGSFSLASTDQTVPRRFSSLEYSRGISPVNGQSSRNVSPHPPPTSALPALPETDTNNLSVPCQNLRRPLSMQIRTCPLPLPAAERHGTLRSFSSLPSDEGSSRLTPPSRAPPPAPLVPSAPLVHFSDQHLTHPSKVTNRRSMPQLSEPPCNPPRCPLPTPPVPRLPPIKLSSGSLRRSVERPLRAALGARAAGLVEVNEP